MSILQYLTITLKLKLVNCLFVTIKLLWIQLYQLIIYREEYGLLMGKPKKRTSSRRTGTRRSHLVLKLARAVNAKSPIKAFTTRRESGKNTITPAKSPEKAAKA